MLRNWVAVGVLCGIVAVAAIVYRLEGAGSGAADFRVLGVVAFAVVSLAGGAMLLGRRRSDAARSRTQAGRPQPLPDPYDELRTLNARLEHAAHEWRTTVDTMDAALIVLEPHGGIVRMNVAAAALLPGALPAWVGRPSTDLAAHSPWNSAMALIGQAARSHAVVTHRVRETSGRTWDLWCRELERREPPAVLLMARDVTPIVELQESVRRSETMAQLGSIMSGVAHEVRNPLFAISSLVDAWAIQPHRDPTPFVQALRSEVGRVRTLMTELLEYGKPIATTRHKQAVGEVIDAAIRECSHDATARRVRVVSSDTADVTVLMDSRRLERVFINLIQNAIQHSPEEAIVRVETTIPASEPTQVAITVRDSGPGFAPEDLPRVFTPFFSRRPGGFGLGLAITDRIVGEHGGRITAANNPAGGAVMTVWLPIAGTRPTAHDPEVQRA